MISSKQQPQRSAAAIASLRAVLTRPGFNGAISCTTRNVSSIFKLFATWSHLKSFHLPGEFTEEEDEEDVAGGDGDAGDERHPGNASFILVLTEPVLSLAYAQTDGLTLN